MKSLFASKTFWGAISGLIVSALSIFKIKLLAEDVQPLLEALGALISAILVIWGRFTAKKQVHTRAPWANLILIVLLPLVGGCRSLPNMKASEIHHTLTFPGVSISATGTGISKTPTTIKAADAEFKWSVLGVSSVTTAKDYEQKIPKDKLDAP
jgi:hypothetical protein